MNKSTEEVLNRGMTYLREKMGTVDAEYFIYLVIKSSNLATSTPPFT